MSEVFSLVEVCEIFAAGIGFGVVLGVLAYFISALFELIKRLTS